MNRQTFLSAVVGVCCVTAWPQLNFAQEATLPEVEVRPPATTSEAVPPTAGPARGEPLFDLSESTLPDLRSTGPSGSSARGGGASGSFGSELSYLEEPLRFQNFGDTFSNPTGLNSIVRGEGNLFETPQLSTIVDRNDLDRRQASTVFRALQNEVGVLLQQTGNGQLSPFIRGLTGQQILILVDGIRMNTSILRPGPNQYTATIDPGMIERVEIVRGAQSAIWGSDAIGGAINFVTRSPDPLRGDYFTPLAQQIYSTAEASSYTRAGVSTWSGQTGIIGGVSYLDKGNLDRGGSLGRQPGTDYEQYAADIKVQRLIADDHLLTVGLQHFEQENLGRSDRFLPFVLGPAPNGSVPTQRPTFFDPQQRDLGYVRLEGLIYESMFADAYSVTFSGSRTKEGSIVDRYSSNSPTAVPTRREIGEFDDRGWGVIATNVKELNEYGKLTYGGDYFDESINSERVEIRNPTTSSLARPVDPQYPDDSRADRVGSFLLWDVALTERLEASTAVRYENIDLSGTPNFDSIGPLGYERTYQDWIGSLGLSYLLTDEWRAIGGVYEGFRAPTIDDLTANKTSLQNNQSVPLLGNLAVQPEHSVTYEVGAKYDDEVFNLQLVEFWTDFDSFISREVIGGVDFLTNQEAYLNGTELAGQYRFTPTVALYGNGFYTYGQITTSDEPISRIPPLQGTLGLRFDRYDHRGYFDVYTWMVDRADRYNQTNLSDVRFIPGGTPGYATLNLRAGRWIGRGRHQLVTFGLENITNKYYRVLGSGVDGAGLNAVFGWQYQ